MDLVSVIVPIYNVEKYLDVCISSIVNQSYQKLEILLIDDGSTDNSPVICEDWGKKDNRIKVIHKKNGGLSDARNAGLNCAMGDWILFVDSDDFISLDLVKIAIKTAHKNHSDLVAFDYLKVGEECNDVQWSQNEIVSEEIYIGKEMLRAFVKNGKGSMTSWNKLYYRSLWENYRFPVGKIHEDEFVIVDILERVQSATIIDLQLYFYRQRQGSIMAIRNKKAEYDALEAFEIRCQKLKNDRELFFPTLNLYLCQLVKLYYIENEENRKKIISLFRKNLKVSFRYIYWKTMIFYLLFAISPKLRFGTKI